MGIGFRAIVYPDNYRIKNKHLWSILLTSSFENLQWAQNNDFGHTYLLLALKRN